MDKILPENNQSNEDLKISIILNFIVNQLKISNIQFSDISNDGRISSATSEDVITDFLKNDKCLTEKLKSMNLKVTIPNIRYWYDFLISDENEDIYIPVNIKISSMKCADNISSKNGVLYALTGNKNICNLGASTKWPKFWEELNEYSDCSSTADYYFLIINKNDTQDVFYASLKTIETLIPNGSNLPFQCNWNNNRTRYFRNNCDAYLYICDIFYKSIHKSFDSIQIGLSTLSLEKKKMQKRKRIPFWKRRLHD